MRKTWYPLLILAASLGLPAAALVAPVVADAPTAPPSDVKYDEKVGKRADYTWVQGHWTWDGTHYVWNAGHWIKNRPGYHWIADSWAQSGNKWHDTPGHWQLNVAQQPVVEDEVDAPDSDMPPAETSIAAPDSEPAANAAPAEKENTDATAANKPSAKATTHPHHVVHKAPPTPNYSDKSQWPFVQHP